MFENNFRGTNENKTICQELKLNEIDNLHFYQGRTQHVEVISGLILFIWLQSPICFVLVNNCGHTVIDITFPAINFTEWPRLASHPPAAGARLAHNVVSSDWRTDRPAREAVSFVPHRPGWRTREEFNLLFIEIQLGFDIWKFGDGEGKQHATRQIHRPHTITHNQDSPPQLLTFEFNVGLNISHLFD